MRRDGDARQGVKAEVPERNFVEDGKSHFIPCFFCGLDRIAIEKSVGIADVIHFPAQQFFQRLLGTAHLIVELRGAAAGQKGMGAGVRLDVHTGLEPFAQLFLRHGRRFLLAEILPVIGLADPVGDGKDDGFHAVLLQKRQGGSEVVRVAVIESQHHRLWRQRLFMGVMLIQLIGQYGMVAVLCQIAQLLFKFFRRQGVSVAGNVGDAVVHEDGYAALELGVQYPQRD